MPGYYDLVLGAIPSTLFGVSGVLHLNGIEFTTAVPLAGLLAVGIMIHAMFVNGPTKATGATSGTTNDAGPAPAPAD